MKPSPCTVSLFSAWWGERGKTLTRMIMEKTVELYGYTSLEDAEQKQK